MSRPFIFLHRLFSICFIVAIASILMLSGYTLALLIAISTLYFLKKRPIPHFTIWLFVGGLAVRLLFIRVLHPPIESDYKTLFEAAESLLAGDVSFHDTAYFTLWAYQSVFVAWEAMWLSIWHDPLCLELVNAVLATTTVCIVYRLAREHVKESSAQTAAVLFTTFPFALTLHTVLSNQIPSAFFFLLGLWILACKDCAIIGFWRFPLAGLLLQLGNLLRSEGLILLAAVLAFAVFETLAHPQTSKQLVLGSLALFIIYFGAGIAANAVVRATDLNPHGVQNGDSSWKIVTGLNFNTSGSYSQDDWNAISSTLDKDHHVTPDTIVVQREMIRERLSAPLHKLAQHAVNKIQLLWCSDSLNLMFRHTQNTPTWMRATIFRIMQQFDRGLFFLSIVLSAFALIRTKIFRTQPASFYLPYCVVFAAFCAFLLIEVQPRYAYLPQIFIFWAATFGLDRLTLKN